MLPFIVVAQLLAADPTPGPSPLQDFIARAADRNRTAPASLREYRAQMESEIAVLLRRADGEESALSLEQSQNEVHWQRGGAFSQHMTGYRARLSGPSMSALAVLRKAWAIPMLYGNEFGVIFGGDSKQPSNDKSVTAASTGSAVAVHPFGPDGERVYAFSGGDTVAVIETQQRRIPVVRVKVEPQRDQAVWPVVAFRGEIDLDADRAEIIRMRGQFVTLDRRGPQKKRLLILPVSVMAYVDLESVEVDGRYWLPRYQRIETHVDVAGLAEGRSVFRIVSRFRGHEITAKDPGLQTVTAFGAIAGADDATYGTPRHQLSMASRDSLERPRPWWIPLGEATAGLRGDDFADVGAESSAPPRTPRLTWRAQRFAELVHLNRVEGWATGATAQFTPGAVAPNILLRANATWAWSEETLRGRVEAMRRDPEGDWRVGMRVGRTLDITNDFTAPRDSGGALFAPLVGVDDYDYVDRRSAMLWFDRTLIPRRAIVRLELTSAMDRGARARLTRGPLGGDVLFRPNRGVDEGAYVSSAMVAEWNPAMNGAALATGVGAMLRTEVASGDLDWHRTTARVNARADRGAMGYALRVDAGVLTSSNAPPQQLFELGGGPAFPGYEYKEFAGDRAMAAHARATYRLPIMRSPLRMFGCTCLTSPAPELAITVHGASLSASSAATRESIARLGSVPDSSGVTLVPLGRGAPLSRTTNGVRSSVEVGLRFFGGAATIALARPTDTRGPWRTIVLLGQPW